MGMSEKNFEKIRALVQPHVGEPVVAAAVFMPRGETGSRMVGGFARGASLGMHADAKARAPGFEKETFLVVTETSVYAFKAKGGLKWKVQDPIGQWPHGTLQAIAEDGKITKALALMMPNGDTIELETQTSGVQSLNARTVDEIVARNPVPT